MFDKNQRSLSYVNNLSDYMIRYNKRYWLLSFFFAKGPFTYTREYTWYQNILTRIGLKPNELSFSVKN